MLPIPLAKYAWPGRTDNTFGESVVVCFRDILLTRSEIALVQFFGGV